MEAFTEEARSQQVTRFFITENNPTEESIERYKELNCAWIAITKEHEDDEGRTPHIHIAIAFNGKRRCTAIKKIFPRADVKIMRGTPQDCVTYMTKENPLLFEKGERPIIERGRRGGEAQKKKWDDAYQAALEGKFDDIPRDIYIRHDRAFHRVYEENKRDPSMEELGDKELKDRFLWLWGPTGTGKSHMARQIAKRLSPEEEPYLKKLNKWWNGYACQKVTIIEEADPERCKVLAGFFKEWADKWNMSAEVKNGFFPSVRPQYIIVTSNYSIEECFPEYKDYDPLKRRFTEHELKFKGEPFTWPQTEIETENFAPVGNISPQEQKDQEEPGIEPGSKRQKVDVNVSETGLIEPPATLDFTPEDFNSEEIK